MDLKAVYVHVHEHVTVYVNVVVDVHVLVDVAVDVFGRIWLQSGPFEVPAAVKPPALPENT